VTGAIALDYSGDHADPDAGMGKHAALRELARFGQLMLDEGRIGDEQVIPAAVIRGMWWGSHPGRGLGPCRMGTPRHARGGR
jgi:CubicO group peptidase (beta-lactamase class C family)